MKNNLIKAITISVRSESQTFSGSIDFKEGLNIIHAENGFGKSLIYSGIGWSLGLERMTMDSDGDNSYFSYGVRENIEIDGNKEIKVDSSASKLDLKINERDLVIRRKIAPPDQTNFIELQDSKKTYEGKFKLGKNTFDNENIGFQGILFKIFGWEPFKARSYQGKDNYLYWENLGCLFFIDQLGGWNDIQSQQIRKYRTLDVEEYAIEYILGLKKHMKVRYKRQSEDSAKRDFKEAVQQVYDGLNKILEKHGDLELLNAQTAKFDSLWDSIKELNIEDFLEKRINYNFQKDLKNYQDGRELIEKKIIGANDNNKGNAYKDKLAELISQRENLNLLELEISKLSRNHSDDIAVLSKLKIKLRSAKDLLLLKKDNLGLKNKNHSCPTCRQEIDAESNTISNLSSHQVEAFISATINETNALEASISRSEKELQLLNLRRKETNKVIDQTMKSLDLQKSMTNESKA